MKFRPYLLAAWSGLTLYLAFPNSLHLHLWPVAWVALVPLFLALSDAASPRQAAKIAGAFGIAGYPLFYHWLVYTMNHYAGMPYAVCFFVLMGLTLTLSLYLIGFGAVYHLIRRGPWYAQLLAAPLAWTAFEYLRGHFPFGGFPWALLAYSQFTFLPAIQIAEFTGPYGVSFLIVLANAAIAMAISKYIGERADSSTIGARAPSPAHLTALKPLALGLIPAILSIIYGAIRIPMVEAAFAPQPKITVGVVQANIDQGIKWDLDYFWQTMDDHLVLTRELMKSNPRLIIWPEAAVTAPGGFNKNWELRTRVILTLSEINTYLLTGGLTVVDCDNPTGEPSRCAKNSVYLLTPHAENLAGRYDKIHLVPFGEYIPMAKILFFADAIARGNTGSTTAGTEIKVLSVPGAHFGCVICYEVIFPELVRKFVKEGAGFMTTVTNDAWFGKTGAPYQHNSNAVFRAVENRVYFVRAANTGVSSLIDPVGKILHQSDLYVPAAFIGEVQPSPLKTFYTRAGDVFAMADAAALLVWLAAGSYLRRASAGK